MAGWLKVASILLRWLLNLHLSYCTEEERSQDLAVYFSCVFFFPRLSSFKDSYTYLRKIFHLKELLLVLLNAFDYFLRKVGLLMHAAIHDSPL